MLRIVPATGERLRPALELLFSEWPADARTARIAEIPQEIEDGDFNHRGELLLKHSYDGKSLDIEYVERTLSYLCKIWGRPVHLETVQDEIAMRYFHDGVLCEMRSLQ